MRCCAMDGGMVVWLVGEIRLASSNHGKHHWCTCAIHFQGIGVPCGQSDLRSGVFTMVWHPRRI